jgi:hypothetical protein
MRYGALNNNYNLNMQLTMYDHPLYPCITASLLDVVVLIIKLLLLAAGRLEQTTPTRNAVIKL